MKSLQGKVVLVTGAGKGTGRRAAELFAARGAVIAAADLTPINLDETISIITKSGGVAKPFLFDIARKLPVQGLLNQVLDECHGIDILINCAEVEPHRSLLEMDEWDWVRTLDVNLTGAFLLTQSAGRIMKEKRGGISEPATIAEEHAAYLTSKAGLEKMVECAADEFQNWNIEVRLALSAEQALELCSP
jgi:NAD(P)-dependent dehydrogenase (short-subunit alcohol dehydrogenase family)